MRELKQWEGNAAQADQASHVHHSNPLSLGPTWFLDQPDQVIQVAGD
jgi:hypothetical protein